MSERKFYRNLITVEVLSEDEPYTFVDFEQLNYDINDGHFVGSAEEVVSTQLNGKECANALINVGSCAEFFNLTDEGEDLEEY